MGAHDLKALVRSTESLAFLVRDTAHVTPANFEICVDAIRAFVEASINGVNKRPSLADQRKKKKSRRSKNTEAEVEIDTESNTEEYHKGTLYTHVKCLYEGEIFEGGHCYLDSTRKSCLSGLK